MQAYVEILAMLPTSHITLGKSLNSLFLIFLICEMGLIIVFNT